MAASTWGARIRAARLATGKTQTQLATELRVSQQLVSGWERDDVSVEDYHHADIARVLGTSRRRLFPASERPVRPDWWEVRGLPRYPQLVDDEVAS